jgi:two-component system, cell cycle response regulator
VKVLIAEDDPVSRRVLHSFLVKSGYDVLIAGDGQEAWSMLQADNAPTLAILDWMMPGLTGIEVCRKLRTRNSHPYVYVLLLTAKGRKEDVVEGIEGGADDYLTKPFDRAELKARLRTGQRILDLQQQLISAQESLRIQATHDPLTGLWNHGEILSILKREVERAQREGSALGVVMADLDHFKQINDTRGHLVGDAVLHEAAHRLLQTVRPYDSVGRYGGEEFLVVVPGCNAESAVRQAERLREAIGSRPVVSAGNLIPITTSLGVAAVTDATGLDSHALLRTADAALYHAKRNGRNRVESSSSPEDEASSNDQVNAPVHLVG